MRTTLLLKRTFAVSITAILAIFFSTQAQQAKKIQDNSFLLEEAYNQEDGVIQHIQTFQLMKNKTWGYSFTQEWPVPKQAHQVSFTVPVNHPEAATSGIGDVGLNYRYQLVFKKGIALSPRLSVLLPSGNYKKGLGSGATGFQINVPLSTELSDKWVTHWNLGSTFVPNAKNATEENSNTFGFNFGTSFIYLLSENFNLMCECVWNSSESILGDGTKTRNDAFFINPGIRFAINFKCGLQIVPGIAMPIGLGPSWNDFGAFAYLSFEHPLF